MNRKIISRGGEDQKTFVKTFRQLTDRHPAWEVWSDFIVMFAIALSNSFDRAHYEAREKQYLKISGNSR